MTKDELLELNQACEFELEKKEEENKRLKQELDILKETYKGKKEIQEEVRELKGNLQRKENEYKSLEIAYNNLAYTFEAYYSQVKSYLDIQKGSLSNILYIDKSVNDKIKKLNERN
jgi:septation ring formation regulator EzrA